MKFSVRTTAIAAIIIIAIILGIVTPKETQAEVKQTYFEEGFGLGYVTCIASGLNGTSKGEEIVSNLGRFEGSMFLSFIHKKIQLTYFWKGSFNNGSFPSKYSSYGSDTAVASESRFMINSMGGIIKRCVKMGLGGGILMRDNLKRRESHHGRDRELLV